MWKMNLQLFAEPKLPDNPITPEINYEKEKKKKTAPDEETPTWASLANLTQNMAQSLNEVLQQVAYYADKGWSSTEVTGAQMTLTLTGAVKPGDTACDYILSDEVMYGRGAARKPHVKLQKGTKVIIWPITLANITPAYGDASAINALTVTVHGNGRPAIGTTAAQSSKQQ